MKKIDIPKVDTNWYYDEDFTDTCWEPPHVWRNIKLHAEGRPLTPERDWMVPIQPYMW